MLYLASAGSELAAMSARSLLVWSRPLCEERGDGFGLGGDEGFGGGLDCLIELGEAGLPGGALRSRSVVGDGGERDVDAVEEGVLMRRRRGGTRVA